MLLYANVNFFMWFFQFDLNVAGKVLSMFVIVLFILPPSPFLIGWYGVFWNGLTLAILDNRLNNLLSNCFPWS